MSIAAPFDVVSALDPAVYHDPVLRPVLLEYRRERDPALIPKITRPGMAPAIYKLRRLKRSEMNLVKTQAYDSQRADFALRMGLCSIEGHPNLDAVWQPSGDRLSDVEMDRLYDAIGDRVMDEMASIIVEESQTPKGSKRCCRLPHSCLRALAAKPSDPPCVDESPGSAEGPSSGKP